MAKKHTLSPEQDTAANPLENVWVQANAGTGKTSVLVQRLLRILFRSPDCSDTGILCLTYTNAGAGEMRNRILAALRQWALATDEQLRDLLDGITTNRPTSDDDLIRAREIFFKYIDRPEIMKIKTIHGFCEEILHRFPLEAGLSPSWTLISDTAQRVLLQDTFNKLVNSDSTDPKIYAAFEHIVDRVSETYMTDLLDILSNQYKQFFQVDDLVKYREYFIETIANFLNLKNQQNTEIDTKQLYSIIKNIKSDPNYIKKPTTHLTNVINLTQQYIDMTIDFNKYKTAYLTQENTKIKNIAKKDYLTAEQDRVYTIQQQIVNQTIFQDTIALFDLASAFATTYRELKRTRNLLDFEDLNLYTRKLFSTPDTMGWVLSQLDLSLSHILVDEAQDTSPLQWDILRMLAGDFFTDGDTTQTPHSLFVVGDTKQSIYGFQGADPRAFATSRNEIDAQIKNNLRTIREIPLDQSFRSTAPILHTVDRFFNDPTIIAETGFANNNHKCFRQDAPGAVEIHKLVAKKESDTERTEYIQNIANKIKELIDTGKFAPKDIMVLVQNRHPMAAPLTAALKRQNIAVAGSDRIVLPNFPAIRDLLNLTRWCLNTADDYSLCCVLKSPIFRLSERDIFNICKNKNDINSERKKTNLDTTPITVFEILQTYNDNIYNQLTQYLNWSKELAPYSFFEHVLNTSNTRHKIISALGTQVIDPLEEFMTICLSYERTQPGTLHHFLKWFITGGSEIKRDMDASSGVRIVTVHGSKGLEAPVVFLVDTIHTPNSENILPISDDPKMPVWIWTSPNTGNSTQRQAATDQIKQIRIAEYYRLLYVAMTRARDELYIYGYTTNKNPPEMAWHTQLWRVLSNGSVAEHIRITNDDIVK